MIGDALGNPLAFTLSGAEQADITQAQPLIDAVPHAQAVIADKGHDADALVHAIEQAGATGYFTKGVDFHILTERLLEVHGRRTGRGGRA
jgi:transposase